MKKITLNKTKKEQDDIVLELEEIIQKELDKKLEDTMEDMRTNKALQKFPFIKKIYYYMTFKERVKLHTIIVWFLALNYILDKTIGVSIIDDNVFNLLLIFAGS